jgi:cytochrome c oxidase subunit 2
MNLPAALQPMSPEASAVAWLFWFFTALCGVIWLLVVVAMYAALYRRRRTVPDSPLELSPAFERRSGIVVASLAILTGFIVAGLTVISYAAQQRLFGPTAPAVDIDVTGHQWWWEAKYNDPDPTKTFVTANELHVPMGRLIRLELTSSDVIHSFWVPSLMGKADLVPGRHNELSFTPDKPGVYGGQCAEFCGLQHAHMGIRVFVDTPEQYEAWKAGQAASGTTPSTDQQQAGENVFTSNACMSCHTIRGTTAGGTLGPDLTHLASRSSVAAVTAELNRGTLSAWIADPQAMKPGANMPTVKLEPGDLDALTTYLMGLK